jgi:LPPG:FO 2-phospho-L-lactate transferase
MADRQWRSVVVLCGGVGGARFLDGLAAVLPGAALTAIVNTGDDFTHWGLHISPDLDTCMYTLSGHAHVERGWGLYDETFHTLEMVRQYGGEDWFQLGDRDLATHLMRTAGLRKTDSLTDVTAGLAKALEVKATLLPMADLPRATWIDTADGHSLAFQDWLVKERAEPPVERVRFVGPDKTTDAVLDAIEGAEIVFVAPSNPYVSVDPILTLEGVREALSEKTVVAVSPIVGGRAVKGPLAGMIWQLDHREPTAGAVADHYGELLAGMVVETGDGETLPEGLAHIATATVMGDREDRARLAREALEFADGLTRVRPRDIWALVPIKGWTDAKTRLGPLFKNDARRVELAKNLATHVLDELAKVPLAGVAVVTDHVEVAQFARDRGAKVLLDTPGAEFAHIIDASLDTLVRHKARGALVVMADLPRLSADDVSEVIDIMGGNPCVVVPDRHGLGTNLLGLVPPGLFGTCFGHADSRARHLAAAARHDVPVVELHSDSLGLDIDTPADVLAFAAAGGAVPVLEEAD